MKQPIEFKTVLLILFSAAIFFGGLMIFKFENISKNSFVISAINQQASSSPTSLASTSASITPIEIDTVSSSSQESPLLIAGAPIKIDGYDLISYCRINDQNYGSIDHIDVLQGTTTVETITRLFGSRPMNNSCPTPEIQDVNFDGYPDFIISANAGTGGDSVYYSLFNSTTKQFYCPGGTTDYCSLMNPTFDVASRTISTWDALGAGDTVSDIYKVDEGNIILYQETEIVSDGTSTTKTVKQLESGKLVIVSTSSSPASH